VIRSYTDAGVQEVRLPELEPAGQGIFSISKMCIPSTDVGNV